MNKLVIFDLDGVLYETRNMHFDTLNASLMWHGFSPISREAHETKYNGLPTRTKLAMHGMFTPKEIDLITRYKQARTLEWIKRNVRRDLKLVSLFTLLHNSGYQIGVATNAVWDTMNSVLHCLELDNMVDVTCAGDSGLHPKPDPAMYYRCMAAASSDPAHTIIVEDSPYGVEGAKLTGATVVVVKDPTETYEAVLRAIGVEP